MMKQLLISVILLTFTKYLFAQSPYQSLIDKDVEGWFDPIPIKYEQRDSFFVYAKDLYKKDSLIKAGQIFDRLFWLDTTGRLGKNPLRYRIMIEKKISTLTITGLEGKWNQHDDTISSESKEDKTYSNLRKNYIVFNPKYIFFYENSELKKSIKISTRQQYNWVLGFTNLVVTYEDRKEDLVYSISNIVEIVSKQLRISKINENIGTHNEEVTYYSKTVK